MLRVQSYWRSVKEDEQMLARLDQNAKFRQANFGGGKYWINNSAPVEMVQWIELSSCKVWIEQEPPGLNSEANAEVP